MGVNINAGHDGDYYYFQFLCQRELFLSGKEQNHHGNYLHGNTCLVLGVTLGLI